MASLEYSQTGISSRALEEAKRRLAGRGTQTPYPSTVSGLTEGVTEREINRAQVAGEDPEEAVSQVGADPRRISTMLRAPMSDMQPAQGSGPMQLREPMTGAPKGMGAQPMTPPVRMEPALTRTMPEALPKSMPSQSKGMGAQPVDPRIAEDAADRAEAEAINRQRRRAIIGAALMTALPDGVADPGAVMSAAQQFDVRAPMERREASRAAAEEARIAEEERALNTDYRQTLMRSMDVNANRRESEMARTGDRDARNYDPAHPLAQQRREFLRRIMASAPEIARGLEGQDLDAMGSADLRNVTDQTLRRIGQTPNRLRQADIDEMMRIAAQLDAADAAPEPAQAAPEATEAPAVQAARRRLGRPAPTAPAAEPTAAPRTDRSLDGIVADIMAERGGQTTSTGQPARQFTQREREVIARGMRSSRTRAAAQLAGGLGTTGQEAQIAQVSQTGAYTNQDVDRASRLLAPVVSRRRQTASLLSRARRLSDAEFAAAMQNSPAFLQAAGFNVETFNADFRALTNVALREASGAAVTDSEAQRFFAALSSNSFSSKDAFMAALNRMLAEDEGNASRVVPRAEVRNAYYAHLRGGR